MRALEMRDEEGFDRDVAVLAAGALGAGLLAEVSGVFADEFYSAELALLSFGATVGVVAAWYDPDDDRAILSSVLGTIGGVLGALLGHYVWLAGAATGGFVGWAMALREDLPGRLAAGGAGALATSAGIFATWELLGPFVGWILLPPGIYELAGGGFLALFLVVASGVRRLQWAAGGLKDQLMDARRERREEEASILEDAAETAGELDGLLRRATPEEGSRARRVADETVRSLVVTTRRSALLREALADRSDAGVAERIDAIDERLEGSESARLRREIEASREEIEGRRETREQLESELARLEVRQHRCVSALERLRMAVAASESADATEGKLEECVDEVDALNREVEWRQQSVEELLGESELEDAEADQPEGAGPVDGEDVPANPAGCESGEASPEEGESRGATSRATYAHDGE